MMVNRGASQSFACTLDSVNRTPLHVACARSTLLFVDRLGGNLRTIVNNPMRFRRPPEDPPVSLEAALAERIIGQPEAVSAVVPFVNMYQAGLSPEGRPAGVFLLLGPSGTGKTKTVEALASVLHGTEKCVLKIDCGEFQMEHEVAKLVGAPPGYLGHRETQPLLNQSRLNAVTSERSALSIVLFDEIEKAAPSLNRLLLGVLDKATLRLGDNTNVNFERSMIFLTSNLGAREMIRTLKPDFGFESQAQPIESGEAARKLKKIGLQAVRRKFSPEFVNRLDAVITYEPLSTDTLNEILNLQLAEFQNHLRARLGLRGFQVSATDAAREFLLSNGTSAEYGARELKRTIHRHVIQPIAALVVESEIEPGSTLVADLNETGDGLRFHESEPPRRRRTELRLTGS